MRQDDFLKPSGKLVPIAEGTENFAFIPDPLPPVVDWDKKLANSLAAATENIGRLRAHINNWENPYLFIAPLIRREAVLSSKIEGTRTTVDDLLRYEYA